MQRQQIQILFDNQRYSLFSLQNNQTEFKFELEEIHDWKYAAGARKDCFEVILILNNDKITQLKNLVPEKIG
jgi:hypothetical protein